MTTLRTGLSCHCQKVNSVSLNISINTRYLLITLEWHPELKGTSLMISSLLKKFSQIAKKMEEQDIWVHMEKLC